MQSKARKNYQHNGKMQSVNTMEEIIGIHKEIKNLNSKIDRILRTLIGDEEMAQEGLVKIVDRHDKYIESQKLLLAKIMGVAIGSGLFGGIVGQILIEYILK
mgnify:CR=1 FL=1|jgi:hypothetical protein|tara:strand:- start:132 stop:437 length:306 start_codon:yes stop_codon:yes gene_type:complete